MDNYQTMMSPSDYETESKRFNFVVKSLLARVRTAGPVEVIAVTNSGGVSPIGYVDIKPLVQQVTGDGSAVDHGVIYNVPYLRVQGGSNAVIIDPQVGDIGLAAFCDRDISKVKATQAQATPGSLRRHNMADAVYLYSIMASAPTQYIQFVGNAINVVSPGTVNVKAPNVNVQASTAANVTAPTASVTATGTASLSAPSVSIGSGAGSLYRMVDERILNWASTHTHLVTAVGSQTAVPTQTIPTCTTSAAKAN